MTRLYQNWRDVPKDKWPWPNFSPRELACKGTGSILVDDVAIDALQKLRDTLGRPLVVVSAYRSPQHNKKVGGAKNSYHMQGCAFDIRMENHNPAEFEIAAKQCGFRGSGFMHIDLGPARTWGTPFKTTETLLAEEVHQPGDRENIAQSTTVQASVVQVASGAGAGVAAISALDGVAQIVVLGLVGVIILAALWIMRERIKKWSEGIR
jgi:zinc D-Ala-D-Ala carboxypeptidase